MSSTPKGGAAGKKFEILPFDNKTNPQWVAKYNDRNPGKEVIYLNYAAVDPVLTNDKCTFSHFRWDANSASRWRPSPTI